MQIPEPSHFPMPMQRYGVNPYGESVYRVVFAPSVKKLVGGEFKDGFKGYRVRPAYRQLGPVWVLERWISGQRHTGMTETKYNEQFTDPSTGLISTGPYPQRGIYVLAEVLNGSPADMNFDWIIGYINKAHRNDPAANQRAILEDLKKQEQLDAQMRFDRCKEALPAFGIRAASYRGHVKATKSAPLMKSANELGLPVRGPSVFKENRHAI